MALLQSASNPRSVGLTDSGLAEGASLGCFMLGGMPALFIAEQSKTQHLS